MKRKTFNRTLLALSLALPLAAFARDAIVVDNIDLQAGPDPDYPAIMQLAGGSEVEVQGCIDGYEWCDVLASGDRGWVPGTFLAEEYEGDRVLLVDVGPRIGIPLVSFEIGAYWGEHYRNRPFFAQRETFVSRRITPHAPRRPSEVALNRVNVNVNVRAGAGHEHNGEQAAHQGAQRGATAHSDTRGQADARTHEREQATHNTAAAGAATPPTATAQQTAQHHAPPTAQSQSAPQADASAHATAETRNNERNVPNVRNDQRDNAHGVEHPMPPTVQSGNGQPRQVAAAKPQPNAPEHAAQPKPQPKSDKNKDKDKDEGNKDHEH